MSQNIRNDIEMFMQMNDPEGLEEYVKSRMNPNRLRENTGSSEKKNYREETRQLSGKDFLKYVRQHLQEMFDSNEEPQEIIKAAVGFAISNYHNGVEIGRGDRKPTGGRKRSWFGKKSRY